MRKPPFYFSGQILFTSIFNNSMFLRHRYWSSFIDNFCWFLQIGLIWGHLRNLASAKMAPQNQPRGAKMAPKHCLALTFSRSWFFNAFWSPFGSLLMRFGILLVPIGSLLDDFQWLFAARFCQYLAKRWLPFWFRQTPKFKPKLTLDTKIRTNT